VLDKGGGGENMNMTAENKPTSTFSPIEAEIHLPGDYQEFLDRIKVCRNELPRHLQNRIIIIDTLNTDDQSAQQASFALGIYVLKRDVWSIARVDCYHTGIDGVISSGTAYEHSDGSHSLKMSKPSLDDDYQKKLKASRNELLIEIKNMGDSFKAVSPFELPEGF